jgi:hypothetical protein
MDFSFPASIALARSECIAGLGSPDPEEWLVLPSLFGWAMTEA